MTTTTPTMRSLIDQIETVRHSVSDEARPEAIERLQARGKQSARARIAQLVDPGSFTEMGGLVAPDAEDGADAATSRARAPADGVVVGSALIGGRPVIVFSQDFSVHGGSIGRIGSAKTQRATQLAITRGVPLVMILDGGGHRIQDGQDSRHFAHANGGFANFARASGWIPMVALMLGAGFAGPTNYAGMADCVVMVRGLSTMGLAGPALVKAATGEDIEIQALGGAVERFHLLRYGLAAVLVFVGVKMVWLDDWFGGKFPIGVSLAIIGSLLALSVALSLLYPARRAEPAAAHRAGPAKSRSSTTA